MTIIEAPELDEKLFDAVRDALRVTALNPIDLASLTIDVLAEIRHAGYQIVVAD